MSGPFHSLSIAGSGMNVYQTWVNAISDNVANINNVSPTTEPAYQERFVIAQAAGTQSGRPDGVRVARAEFGNAAGRLVHNPDHPYADEEGFVRVPDVDLTDQMTNLMIAQRAYQANVTTFRTAREAYQRALEIGR